MAATNAPVNRAALTKAQKAARTALFYVMADAVDALLGAEGIAYTKIPKAEVPGGQ